MTQTLETGQGCWHHTHFTRGRCWGVGQGGVGRTVRWEFRRKRWAEMLEMFKERGRDIEKKQSSGALQFYWGEVGWRRDAPVDTATCLTACCVQDVHFQGTWVARLVKHPTSAQVMTSWFVSLSLSSVSVLTAWRLLRILCLPPLHPSLSPSQKER